MNPLTVFVSLIVIVCFSICHPLHGPPTLSIEERELVEQCYYESAWKFWPKHMCYSITNASLPTEFYSVSNMRVLYRDYIETEKYDKSIVQHCFDHQDEEPDILIDVNGNAVHMPCEGITSGINQDWTSRRDANKRSYFMQLTNEQVVKTYEKMRKRLESSTSEPATTMDPDQLAIC